MSTLVAVNSGGTQQCCCMLDQSGHSERGSRPRVRTSIRSSAGGRSDDRASRVQPTDTLCEVLQDACFRKMWILCLLLAACPIVMCAQKVNVGYDKTADFSKYKTYTWLAPAVPPSRPILYNHVVATIDDHLKLKGLKRVPRGGDLTVAGGGGIGFGSSAVAGAPLLPTYVGPPPSLNSNMWVGTGGLAPIVAEGTLLLEFVDPKTNNIVWSGNVSEKLDIEKQSKSLERVNRAIAKLLAKFPPRTRS